MSQEQKPLEIAEKSEKFYKTEEFKQLSAKEKKEKLTQHAQKIKTQLNKNYNNIIQNTKTTALVAGGGYIGYRLLRWVFGNKKKSSQYPSQVAKTVVVTEKKQKKRSFFTKIQDKVFDFIWDFAIDTVQDQLINRFFKKKKKKKNGKKDS